MVVLSLLPQLWRNTILGYRKVPMFTYALSMSVFGLALPAYVNFCPRNIIFKKPEPFEASLTVGFSLLCLLILGPSKAWVPAGNLPPSRRGHWPSYA